MEASFCMKTIRIMFWSLVGTLLITRSILGYSTGAQMESCTSLTVDHVDGNGNPIPASTSTSPFTVRVLSGDGVYRVNRAVKVVIDVPSSRQFTGFVLQARETATATPVGQWNSSLADGTKTISCTSESDTITHSSNLAVTSTLELQWTPTRDYGQVEFWASVAEDFNVFWNNIRSQPVTFDSRAVFYVNQTEVTLTEGERRQYVAFCVNRPIEQVNVGLTFTANSATTADIIAIPMNLNLPANPSFLCWPVGLIPEDDGEPEGPEILLLAISSVGGTATIDDTASSVEITILDNDVGIAFRESSLQVSEADGQALIEVCASTTLQDATPVGFTVERLGDPTSAVTQDLTFSSPVTIPSGQDCSSIRINIVPDNLDENVEIFLVRLTPSEPNSNIRISETPLVLRLFNSAPGDVGISITSESLNLPENSGSAQVQVCASRPVDEDVTVDFNIIKVSSVDPASDDITFSSPLIIVSGTTCNFINIFIEPDNVVEETETFLLTLTSAAPFGVLRQSSLAITVMDSEEPTTLSSVISINRTISVREDDGRAAFMVCATPPPPRSVTIEIQAETISSLAGGISVNNRVTIPSNTACVQPDLVILDDNIPESDERYTVSIIFVPLPHNVSSDYQLAVTVIDNDEDIAPCSSSPCENDGTCVPRENQMFDCLCSYGFVGSTCSEEEMFLPVSISPSSLQVKEGDNFTLTVCYSGVQTTTDVSLSTNLESADEQDLADNFPIGAFTVQVNSSQECTSLNGKLVNDNEFEGEETFSVTILSVSTDSSMRLDERETTASVTISEKDTRCIIEMPCQNGGQCIDEEDGGFSCNCATGWIGDTCEISDPCLPNPCQNSGVCSIVMSGDNAESVCMCTNSWTGDNCENAVVCLDNPCQNGANCEVVQDGSDYQCTNCPMMYEGKNCDIFLPCSSDPCRNGGTCTNLGQIDFECSCLSQYAGKDCTFDNPCLSNPCQNGDCEARDDGLFQCLCHSGFFGSSCETAESCLQMPCQNGGSCVPSQSGPGEFECMCRDGFKGLRCHRVDICHDEPCLNGGTCSDQDDSFTCMCLDGFSGDRCNIEMVPFNPGSCFSGPCINGGICIESANSFRCNCPRGWTGNTCNSRQRCIQDEDPSCQNGGTCYQTLRGVTCECQSGYTGFRCELDNTGDEGDFCVPNPCQNGGSCFQPDDGNFVCTCVSDLFGGARCQSCLCKNGGTCLTDRCVCPQGAVGERCETLEACINFNCNNGGTCFVENDIPMCDCQDGFLGDTCDITDQCRDVTCFNGGTCQQADGKCSCPSRFGGEDCSVSLLSQTSSSPVLQGSIFCLLLCSIITLFLT
ncbi:Neurogenic locus notch-like protein 1 [Holothuria leucospilota]|uniref:Neurogenic locus notch-like protein 1 n=1 Tax=Holothuria leucospilota TaxID=206669 RepID=A0A9Q1CL28_HOLLE|nr:Neurogenic locus notch-like protein 1 [Holothuria leucospilota]